MVKKLGIKNGFRMALLNAPEGFLDWLDELPLAVEIDRELNRADYDFVHAFYVHSSDYQADFDRLKAAIVKNGMIWISWYKKAAKNAHRYHRKIVVRDVALTGGLADVKVAAIDAQWSGLKLVYRRGDR